MSAISSCVLIRGFTTATELTTDVLSHQIWGPRKKSWGIEMTIATSLVRGTGRHTGLIDIVRLISVRFYDILIDILYLGYHTHAHEHWRACTLAFGCTRHPRNVPRTEAKPTGNSCSFRRL